MIKQRGTKEAALDRVLFWLQIGRGVKNSGSLLITAPNQ